MLAPREIDEYLLPTERRVIRVRQHWASMISPLNSTALFLLVLVIGEMYLPPNAFVDNLFFYLGLMAVLRFTVLVILWWIERIVITDKRVMLAVALFLLTSIVVSALYQKWAERRLAGDVHADESRGQS